MPSPSCSHKISKSLQNLIQSFLGVTWRVVTCACKQSLELQWPHGISEILPLLPQYPLQCLLPGKPVQKATLLPLQQCPPRSISIRARKSVRPLDTRVELLLHQAYVGFCTNFSRSSSPRLHHQSIDAELVVL